MSSNKRLETLASLPPKKQKGSLGHVARTVKAAERKQARMAAKPLIKPSTKTGKYSMAKAYCDIGSKCKTDAEFHKRMEKHHDQRVARLEKSIKGNISEPKYSDLVGKCELHKALAKSHFKNHSNG